MGMNVRRWGANATFNYADMKGCPFHSHSWAQSSRRVLLCSALTAYPLVTTFSLTRDCCTCMACPLLSKLEVPALTRRQPVKAPPGAFIAAKHAIALHA